MPLVNVLVNGRAYTVACDEGEEDHLRDLAQHFDRRVRELVGTVGQAGDGRLLLMAGLVICDELSDALGRLEECQKDIANLRAAVKDAAAEEAVIEALDAASTRVEAIAARVAAP